MGILKFNGESYTGGTSDVHAYSTTEKVVGTWIDGSPIYEKVFSFQANLPVGEWVGTGQTLPNNASHLIDVKGFDNDTNSTGTIPFIGYIDSNKQLMVMNVRGQALTNKNALAIVQYIKSST